jgi:tetratricopeptide (TPR) repeat protein
VWPRFQRFVQLAAFGCLEGCTGELATLAALAFGMSLSAWILGRDRHRRALYAAETLKHAIGTGQHRGLEDQLRQELALAAAGEAVSQERQWLARAQLGGLLVAQWRLDEAADVYGSADGALRGDLRVLATFGRHELAVLTGQPGSADLEAIRRDRDASLQFVPGPFRGDVQAAWNALEGLCLVRMGQAREAVGLLERGLRSLQYNPARVVYLYHLGQAYEHIGERKLATETYAEAALAFPGTRLASEARARGLALGEGTPGSTFRAMLPEAPEGQSGGGERGSEGV